MTAMHPDAAAAPEWDPFYRAGLHAPYDLGVNRIRRMIGWEETPAGAVVARECAARGLTDEHVPVFCSASLLTISWPTSISGMTPITVPSGSPPEDLAAIRSGLDLCVAALSREAMMRMTDWREDRPPPAWSLETTSLTARLLGAERVPLHHAWQLAECDGEIGVTLASVSAHPVALRRNGKPRPSPIVIAYGSFEAFADQTYAEIRAGKLDQNDALTLVEVLRHWEVSGIWEMALATASLTRMARCLPR